MRITTTYGNTIEIENNEWMTGCSANEIGMENDGNGNLTCLNLRADEIAEAVEKLYRDEMDLDEFLEIADR